MKICITHKLENLHLSNFLRNFRLFNLKPWKYFLLYSEHDFIFGKQNFYLPKLYSNI